MTIWAAIFLAGLAPRASAETPPVEATLEAAASGQHAAAECFDGGPVPRREGPLLILEETEASSHYMAPRTEFVEESHRPRSHGALGHWTRRPGALITEFRQKVQIADRAAYRRGEIGSAMTVFGLFGTPIAAGAGWLAAAGGMGIAAASGIGAAVLAIALIAGFVYGRRQGDGPDVFERTVERRHNDVPPPH